MQASGEASAGQEPNPRNQDTINHSLEFKTIAIQFLGNFSAANLFFVSFLLTGMQLHPLHHPPMKRFFFVPGQQRDKKQKSPIDQRKTNGLKIELFVGCAANVCEEYMTRKSCLCVASMWRISALQSHARADCLSSSVLLAIESSRAMPENVTTRKRRAGIGSSFTRGSAGAGKVCIVQDFGMMKHTIPESFQTRVVVF